MSEVKKLHEKHRDRVRNRFIRERSLENFEEHQVLELLLFYAVPRRDTNELAHRLINEYGSLYNLMNASPESIEKRCKVSKNTAVLISMIPSLTRKFLTSGNKELDQILAYSVACKYFGGLMVGQDYESFYMICLDLNKYVKKIVKISDGTRSQTPVVMEVIMEHAIMYGTTFVLIGHNHPSGNKLPSSTDLEATSVIQEALNYVNVKLLDHIIVCGDEFYSFAQNNCCNLG